MKLVDSLPNLGHYARGVGPVLKRIKSVSFAFYAEDLILSHMRPRSRGFYVDVGAFHPQTLSNTYKLYLKGWSGLTIEPNPDAAATFRTTRPRDTHLTIGIAAEASELTYYKFSDGAQNTFDASRAAELDTAKVAEQQVSCVPLNDVFERYCREAPVDLLSVDCESRDVEVLHSLDWRAHRPTVLIVEDFEQFEAGASPTSTGSQIRSFMLDQDYALASQAIFSCFYVDRRAFGRNDRTAGFDLARSQLGLLARKDA